MRKNISYIFIFLISITIGINNCYASSAKITRNSGTITKGNSVNVTVTINTDKPLVSIEGSLVCSGAVSKSFDLNYDDSSNSLTSKSFTYTLTPTSSGTITCYIVNTRVTHMGTSSWESLAADKVVITVNDPPVVSTNPSNNTSGNSNVIKAKEKSNNNFLTSLSVEGLKLDSDFDKEKLEYTVNVPAETEKIKINGQLADSKAKVTGLGEKEVKTGLNTIEIVVTAENGNKRTYTIKATVLELVPTIVNIDSNEYTVIKNKDELPKISEYYKEKEIKIGEESVPGYTNELLGYDLVALKDSKGNINYYIYNNNKYTLYKEYTFNGQTLEIIDKSVSNGKKVTFSYDGDRITAYQTVKLDILKNTYALDSDEITGNQFYLFYAKNIETGKESLYQYDAEEKTVQRFNAELLDMYKHNSDTYYIFLLIAAFINGLLLLIIGIVSIKKSKKKPNKKRTKKVLEEDDEEE